MSTLQRKPRSARQQPTDTRPRFGIGHVSITATDVEAVTDFYTSIGMRLVVKMGRFAIVELRGGTHLIIQPGQPGQASLDLIVSDIDDTRAVMATEGANPTVIERGSPHDRFIASDPEGNTLIINSDHSIGVV